MKKYKSYDFSYDVNIDEWITPEQIKALKPALDACKERNAKNISLTKTSKGGIVKSINHSKKE